MLRAEELEPIVDFLRPLGLRLVVLISSRSIKQEVGYYLHREGPNLGKHCVPRLLLPSALDAQFGAPYPRSAGFDTNNDDDDG